MSNNNLSGGQNNNSYQHLSELLDDCVTTDAAEELLNSQEQHAAWYRYNLVSSVIRKEESAYSSFEFTQSISDKIAQEPAIIARAKTPANENSVRSSGKLAFLRRTGGGLAIAASVAYAMVFSVDMMQSESGQLESQLANETVQKTVQEASQVSVAATNDADDAREQADLDYLQAIINGMDRHQVNEQLVDGEAVFSWKVRANELDELQQQVSNMKKPLKVIDEKR